MKNERSISEIFADIDSYLFKYNQEAQSLYGKDRGVDNKPHVGIMAQELQENPVTEDTVDVDENGYLAVDNNQLTMTLCAVVADLAKRVNELENIINQGM